MARPCIGRRPGQAWLRRSRIAFTAGAVFLAGTAIVWAGEGLSTGWIALPNSGELSSQRGGQTLSACRVGPVVLPSMYAAAHARPRVPKAGGGRGLPREPAWPWGGSRRRDG